MHKAKTRNLACQASIAEVEAAQVEIIPKSSSPSGVLNISSKISFPSVDSGGSCSAAAVGSSRELLILRSRSSFQMFSSV